MTPNTISDRLVSNFSIQGPTYLVHTPRFLFSTPSRRSLASSRSAPVAVSRALEYAFSASSRRSSSSNIFPISISFAAEVAGLLASAAGTLSFIPAESPEDAWGRESCLGLASPSRHRSPHPTEAIALPRHEAIHVSRKPFIETQKPIS